MPCITFDLHLFGTLNCDMLLSVHKCWLGPYYGVQNLRKQMYVKQFLVLGIDGDEGGRGECKPAHKKNEGTWLGMQFLLLQQNN